MAKHMLRSIRSNRLHWALLVILALLQACASSAPRPDDPAYSPVVTASPRSAPASDGSLFQAGTAIALFHDNRAHRIGDVLTVTLNETTVSSKTAETEIVKETGVSMDAGAILGVVPSHGGYNLGTEVTQDRDFKGTADSDQRNSLLGSITVMVSDVMPNGLLVVRGEKWITLTNGDEFIRVKGLVRPQDIGPDNSISSTKLADARITYSGTGELAEANRQGWLGKFFNSSYWPF